jgi:hypothetical protein
MKRQFVIEQIEFRNNLQTTIDVRVITTKRTAKNRQVFDAFNLLFCPRGNITHILKLFKFIVLAE